MKIKKGVVEVSEITIPEDLNEVQEWFKFNSISSYIDPMGRINVKTLSGEELNLRKGYKLYLINGIPIFAEIPEYNKFGEFINRFIK